MKQRYADWIAVFTGDLFGKCAEITLDMVATFPELTRVRGHYHDPLWGKRAHWWMVDPEDGSVVDPTATQFPTGGAFEYVPIDEDSEEPIGKCANCGGESYRSTGGDSTVCSESCHSAYAEYIMGGVL